MRLRGYNIAGGVALNGMTAAQLARLPTLGQLANIPTAEELARIPTEGELALIPTAVLPVPAGNASKHLKVNAGADGYEAIAVSSLPNGNIEGDGLIWLNGAWANRLPAVSGYGNALPVGMFTESMGSVGSYGVSNGLMTVTHALTAGNPTNIATWDVAIIKEALPVEMLVWCKFVKPTINNAGSRYVKVAIELLNQANTRLCGLEGIADQTENRQTFYYSGSTNGYSSPHDGIWFYLRIDRTSVWAKFNSDTLGDTRYSPSDQYYDWGSNAHADPNGSATSYKLRLRTEARGEDTATAYIKHYSALLHGIGRATLLTR